MSTTTSSYFISIIPNFLLLPHLTLSPEKENVTTHTVQNHDSSFLMRELPREDPPALLVPLAPLPRPLKMEVVKIYYLSSKPQEYHSNLDS